MGITGKNYVWIAAKCVIARTRQLNENNPVMLEFDHVKFPPGMFGEFYKPIIRRVTAFLALLVIFSTLPSS